MGDIVDSHVFDDKNDDKETQIRKYEEILSDYCYIEYDGWDHWSLFSIGDVLKRMKNHQDMEKVLNFEPWSIFNDALKFGHILISRDGELNVPCGFIIKKSELIGKVPITNIQKMCIQCND